tara:strand:+ start:447 stop:731 length:285 start_codon:yes stop_codon:yes gene_type:complete
MNKFESHRKRTVRFLFLILFFGIIVGSVMHYAIGIILPEESTVTRFFTESIVIGWEPFEIDLKIIIFTIGFLLELSVCSIIGLFVSWYFLRYFK